MSAATLPFGGLAAERLLGLLDMPSDVLDVGSGGGAAADLFRAAGHRVQTVDVAGEPTWRGAWPDVQPTIMVSRPGAFDAIWSCHVLEHSTDPGAFLRACWATLRVGGWLAVTVPPAKYSVVGGHPTLWTAGTLLYQLVLAGFDCARAQVRTYDYNISVLVQRTARAPLPALAYDHGDLERLAPYFPVPVVGDSFDGRIDSLNWELAPMSETAATYTPWTHPTGGRPRRVALVGNGVTHQDYIAECLGYNTPDTVHGRDEVWAINRGGLALRHDLLWVMDHIGGEAAKFPRYGDNLRRHDRPIITSDDADGWPAHVHRYPLAEIRAHYGPAHDYYHNSVAYILAYAGWLGVEEITLWGCDYHYDGNPAREPDRANAEYWVAILRERGVSVQVPQTSTLLNANRQPWFYGYRMQPAGGLAHV